jgi:hypothetical protein
LLIHLLDTQAVRYGAMGLVAVGALAGGAYLVAGLATSFSVAALTARFG